MKSVSIFLNSKGFTASPTEEGLIRVYTHNAGTGSWEMTKEFEFSLLKSISISDLRNVILSMIQRIGNCRIFAARQVAGQLYSILEANQFHIYEVEGTPEQFLESILAAEEEDSRNREEKIRQASPPYPEKTGVEGVYFLNLKDALNADPGLTSKKILLPFLADRNFKSLEVICDHVPRWFNEELEKQGFLSASTKFGENEYKVVISAK